METQAEPGIPEMFLWILRFLFTSGPPLGYNITIYRNRETPSGSRLSAASVRNSEQRQREQVRQETL